MSQTEFDPFEAAAAALDVMFEDHGDFNEPEEPATEVSVTPELTVDASGRAHGPDGKFVSLEETTEPPAEEAPAEVEATEETVEEPEAEAEVEPPEEEVLTQEKIESIEWDLDPELEPVLEKYGGDLNKALKALEHQEALIGRQSQEVGEIRQLREELAAMRQASELQIAASQIDWEEVISESPEQAANLAIQYQNSAALTQALKAWMDEDPADATLYMMALQRELDTPAAQEAPAATQVSQDEIGQEFAKVLARHPDAQEDRVVRAIAEIAEQRPTLNNALKSGSAVSRAQAFEDLYHLAKSRMTSSDTSQAAKRVALKARADNEQAKADAVVVSANRGSAAKAPSDTEVLQHALRELGGLDDDFVIVG